MTLLLFFVTAAIYSRAAYFPFSVIDDGYYVTKNVHVASGLTLDSIKWAFTTFHAGNWHPLTWLSLMLDSQLFGENPMGFHLVNVFLHAANASLVYLLFSAMTGALWRSAFVAACFALHPLHVESVAWIAERKDVLSTLLWMLTLLLYTAYVKQGKRSMYVLSLVAFALGLMAKPMLVTIPVVLVILDFWPFERIKLWLVGRMEFAGEQPVDSNGRQLKLLFFEKVPFLALSVLSSVITLYAQKPSLSSLANVPFSVRVSNALWSLLMYVKKMLLPFDLAVLYPLVPVQLWRVVCAVVLLGGVTFMVVKYRHRFPYLTAGWFWYLITLMPVIGIVQVGRQSMADRYTYIPLIGLFAMASWGGAEICSLLPRLKIPIRLLAVGAILYLSVLTWTQLGYWRDNLSLVNHTLDVTENNYFAHFCRGLVYEEQGKKDQAIAEFGKSIEIEPRDPLTHFELGYLLDGQGRTSEGIRHLEEAITFDPNFAKAHFCLGIMLGKIGAIDESIKKFNDAIRIEPDNPKFRNNLGTTLAQQGRLDEAIEQFSIALQLNPSDEKAFANLQIALHQKSQMGAK